MAREINEELPSSRGRKERTIAARDTYKVIPSLNDSPSPLTDRQTTKTHLEKNVLSSKRAKAHR
jgi:hypothetical protein